MTINRDQIPFLRTVSLFASLSDEVLAQVAADLDEVQCHANERVFTRGDPGTKLYIVAKGRVRIHDGDLIFTYRNQSEFFGEMAALQAGIHIRSASVTAEEDSILWLLDQERLHSLTNTYTDFASAIIAFLAFRLRDSTQNRVADFEYIRQVRQIIDAAQALEAGNYAAEMLDEVSLRTDDLGQLAHVFRKMADEVQARERRLQQEVLTLKIEIDRVKQAQQVASITESGYFKMLQEKAHVMRRRSKAEDEPAPGDTQSPGFEI
jgi:CRP-like cAMP-binding protein